MLGWLGRIFLRYQNNSSAWIWTFTLTYILFSCQNFWTFSLETATSTHWSRSKSWWGGGGGGWEAKVALKFPFSWLYLWPFPCVIYAILFLSLYLQHWPPFQAGHLLQHLHIIYTMFLPHLFYPMQVIFLLFFYDIYFLEVTVFSIVNLICHQIESPVSVLMSHGFAYNFKLARFYGELKWRLSRPSLLSLYASLGVESKP
jgi:hypothetical protein